MIGRDESMRNGGEARELRVCDEGFTVLHDCDDALTDIVLIHGLQGHPKKTWQYKSRVSTTKRLPGLLHRSHDAEANRPGKADCFWPKDLLPLDFPKCRIMTYGYDSHVSNFFAGSANQANIKAHATSLLHDLCGQREGPTRGAKSVIWIAHSLGGLLLKEALRLSSQAARGNHLRAVYDSTIATIFLGTPHRGSNFADWALMLQRAVGVLQLDTNPQNIRDLRVDSPILDRLNDDFSGIYEQNTFDVYSFREEKRMSVSFMTFDKVVHSSSAKLGYGREHVDFINADHRQMCRFSGADDNGYRKVSNALKQSIRRHCLDYTKDEKFSRALKDLHFSETLQRFQQVDEALEGTFEWLFTDESLGFTSWLKSDRTLYWVRGKPASGKSTLMKMALKDKRTAKALQRKGKKCCTASFFFHDRGSFIQKSFQGLLSAVLHKILSDIPRLKRPVHSVFRTELSIVGNEGFRWTIETLLAALNSVLRQGDLPVFICLFLDALDEHSGTRGDMVKFLGALSDKGHHAPNVEFKVCFSSRMEQAFVDSFSQLPGFRIHEYTKCDIARLVESKLSANGRMCHCLQHGTPTEKKSAGKFKGRILSQAEGVFLWVKLVLDQLLEEYTDGKSIEQLNESLDTKPGDLQEFYQFIVQERIDPKYAEESRVMFELVSCALSPLNAKHFFWAFGLAMRRGDGALDFGVKLPNKSTDEIYRLLGSRSGGLIEIREPNGKQWHPSTAGKEKDLEPKSCMVQFLHQSVKTFAISRRGSKPLAKAATNGFADLFRLGMYTLQKPNCSPHQFACSCDPPLLLDYAQLAEDTAQTAQTELLHETSISRLMSFWENETDTLALPHGARLPGFATLAKLPLTLEELLKSASPQTSQCCLERFCLFYLHSSQSWRKYSLLAKLCGSLRCSESVSDTRSLAVLRVLLKYNQPSTVWTVIRGFIDDQQELHPQSPYLICGFPPACWKPSAVHGIRGYFKRLDTLIRRMLESGADVNRMIPTRKLTPQGDGWHSNSWTHLIHLAATSAWVDRGFLRVVLSARPLEEGEEGSGSALDINALNGEGKTALDLALQEYSHYARPMSAVLERSGMDEQQGREVEYVDRWRIGYTERFKRALMLVDKGAKVSGSYIGKEQRITRGELDMLRSVDLPVDTRLLSPPRLDGGGDDAAPETNLLGIRVTPRSSPRRGVTVGLLLVFVLGWFLQRRVAA